jgi:BirA family transcriptional regulator, biotin operon repressor / biotin---[acetyl-CoA-carboxylase] ligase
VNRVVSALAPANVIWLDDIDSTNAVAERLVDSWLAAEEDRLPETLLVAQRQSAGRGRGAHGWQSPPGGLYATWLAWVPVRILPMVPMAVGVSLAGAVEELVPGLRVGLKWPNDLLVRERKLGGVLCASRTDGDAAWVTVGFGINVGADPVLLPGHHTDAVSLASLGFAGDAGEGIWSLVAGFLARIHPALADSQGTRAQWVARSIHRAGEVMRLRLHSGVVEGRFVGFGQDGELELEVGGELDRFSTGELLGEKEPGG